MEQQGQEDRVGTQTKRSPGGFPVLESDEGVLAGSIAVTPLSDDADDAPIFLSHEQSEEVCQTVDEHIAIFDTWLRTAGAAAPSQPPGPWNTRGAADANDPAQIREVRRRLARLRRDLRAGRTRARAARQMPRRIPQPRRRLDRNLGCGRPAARRTSSASSASRGDPSDLAGDDPPRHRPLAREGVAA